MNPKFIKLTHLINEQPFWLSTSAIRSFEDNRGTTVLYTFKSEQWLIKETVEEVLALIEDTNPFIKRCLKVSDPGGSRVKQENKEINNDR